MVPCLRQNLLLPSSAPDSAFAPKVISAYHHYSETILHSHSHYSKNKNTPPRQIPGTKWNSSAGEKNDMSRVRAATQHGNLICDFISSEFICMNYHFRRLILRAVPSKMVFFNKQSDLCSQNVHRGVKVITFNPPELFRTSKVIFSICIPFHDCLFVSSSLRLTRSERDRQ